MGLWEFIGLGKNTQQQEANQTVPQQGLLGMQQGSIGQQQVNPPSGLLSMGSPAFQDRINNPQNYPFISNPDGRISTHEMAAEVDQNGNWFAFPTIVMQKDGTLKRFEGNPHEIMRMNKEMGNYMGFGKDKEAALRYAQGGYKTQALKDWGMQNEMRPPQRR